MLSPEKINHLAFKSCYRRKIKTNSDANHVIAASFYVIALQKVSITLEKVSIAPKM